MVRSAGSSKLYMLDSTVKTTIYAILLGLLATGCVLDEPSPQLGDCAVPPEGETAWEFGQVGIGTCVASPSDLRVVADPLDPGNHFLLVANSNARANFSGSSLLSIDASSIDLECPTNGLHEVDATALTMQEFVGRFDIDERTGVALVSNRHTGAFEGDLTDALFVVDASDPRALAFSDAGPRETGPYRWIRTGADPWSVRVDPTSGRAWVLELTPHTVSAVDLVSDPIAWVDLHGERSVGDPTFEDLDGTGSAPDFDLLGVNDSILADETVTLTYIAGTTRLYYPAPDGLGAWSLYSADSGDGAVFVEAAGGPVVRPASDWAAAGLGTASVTRLDGALSGLIAGTDASGVTSIGRINAPDHALDWNVGSAPIIEPLAGAFDADGVSDPDFVLSDDRFSVYWSGGAGLGHTIGRAAGESLNGVARAGDDAVDGGDDGAVLAPDPLGWDSASVHAPSVVVHGDSGEFLLFYAGHDDDGAASDDLPDGLSIGLARSPNGRDFVREDNGPVGDSRVLLPGDDGEWDDEAVAAPSVFFADGRFQMWFQGYDGVAWRTGRATSIDGKNWSKDDRNPVYDGVWDDDGLPRRAFAFKASPGGYYRIEGDVTGQVPAVAFEGAIFDSALSPVLFTVVGGQALGRGDEGTIDDSGAGAPGPTGDGTVLYVAREGSARRLAAATDVDGAGLDRLGAVEITGLTGTLAGLTGDDPTVGIQGVDAATFDGDAMVGFHVDDGIVLATGDLSAALSLASVTDGPALTRGEPGEFDDTAVRSPSLVLDEAGERRMYYGGDDGDARRIGLATSVDGVTWERSGLVLDRGAAGSWDDAWVGMPSAVYDGTSWHLWYVGSDGARLRVGYATSTDGLSWQRHTDGDGISTPVFAGAGLSFAGDDVIHPTVRLLPDGDGFEMWFEGRTNGISRIGRARSTDGIAWTPVTNATTAGDRFVLTTRAGDDSSSSAVELGDDRNSPRIVDGFPVHGAGAAELILDPTGRFGIVSNKRSGDLIVIDLYDDSDDDFVDSNYGDIEVVIRLNQRHGMVGLRDMEFDADGRLWALLAPLVAPGSPTEFARFGTEGLVRIDWESVMSGGERAAADLLFDDVVDTFVPLARGVEEDKGYLTEVSVGPSAMQLSADGDRAYVVNFNDNSLYVVDLSAGARGAVIAIVDTLDENPWEVALSPDERLAYVANYYGVGDVPVQHSTLQVVDVDETSPTFGRVLTRLNNVGSRSDHGCP